MLQNRDGMVQQCLGGCVEGCSPTPSQVRAMLRNTKIWDVMLCLHLKVMWRVSCARRLGWTLWELSTSSERFFHLLCEDWFGVFRFAGTMQQRTSARRSWWTDGQLLSRRKGESPQKKTGLQQILIQSSWPAMPRTSSLTWGRRPCHLLAKTGWKGCRSSLESFTLLKQ